MYSSAAITELLLNREEACLVIRPMKVVNYCVCPTLCDARGAPVRLDSDIYLDKLHLKIFKS